MIKWTWIFVSFFFLFDSSISISLSLSHLPILHCFDIKWMTTKNKSFVYETWNIIDYKLSGKLNVEADDNDWRRNKNAN